MASSKHVEYKKIDYAHPEKVVIVAGPSFGTAIKFMLLGAAIGAGATYFLVGNKGAAASGEDAVTEGLSADGAKQPTPQELADRAGRLAKRISSLASRVKETAQSAKQTLGPAIGEAVSAGREAARSTTEQLEDDLRNAPDKPNVAAEQA